MKKNKTAFTIIELLVVMAILIIMMSILLPVFWRVKERVNQTKCAFHLKQLGTAIQMYADDHDDGFPIGGYDVPASWGNPRSFRLSWRETIVNTGYVNNYLILICPSAKSADYRYSYGANRHILGWKMAARFASIPFPTRTALVSEKKGLDWPIFLPNENINNPFYQPMDARHSLQLNILFCDGHLGKVAVGELISSSDIQWAIPTN